jgi:hypothetical protein
MDDGVQTVEPGAVCKYDGGQFGAINAACGSHAGAELGEDFLMGGLAGFG